MPFFVFLFQAEGGIRSFDLSRGLGDRYKRQDLNVACDGPSGRGPWMGRVIRSQHISHLKYEGYK
ncbi:hypothetical protein C4813_24255 [Salmonella enterica subsp. enterica serovar Rubislaw]|nr:hypothetical protein C4813_24255 [Salmonella enterica subsp. enterica serovar Rubislaw]